MADKAERVKELQNKLHDRRKQLASLRAEMDEIEAELRPLLDRESGLSKLQRAGLSEAEMKAIMAGDQV